VICDQMRYLTKNMKTYLEVVKEDKIHGTCRIGGKQLVIIKPDRKKCQQIIIATLT
jgi:hypothetical protein